jgi:hypothetical protein
MVQHFLLPYFTMQGGKKLRRKDGSAGLNTSAMAYGVQELVYEWYKRGGESLPGTRPVQ